MKIISQHRKKKHPDEYEELTGIKVQPTKPQPAKPQPAKPQIAKLQPANSQPPRLTPETSLTSTLQKRGLSSSTALDGGAISSSSQKRDVLSPYPYYISAADAFDFNFAQLQDNWAPNSLDVNPRIAKRQKYNESLLYSSLPILGNQAQEHANLEVLSESASSTDKRPIALPELQTTGPSYSFNHTGDALPQHGSCNSESHHLSPGQSLSINLQCKSRLPITVQQLLDFCSAKSDRSEILELVIPWSDKEYPAIVFSMAFAIDLVGYTESCFLPTEKPH